MAMYYLDIETTGLDQDADHIITIQYQELERGTGRPLGDVTILKEWEMGERDMLATLMESTPITGESQFGFIPVGYNLKFEHKFLFAKTTLHSLPVIDISSRPCVDLHGTGILMNAGEFKGSGLDKITGKKESGGNVPAWYESGSHDLIERYIVDETKEFVKWYRWLLDRLPNLRNEWNRVLSGQQAMRTQY